MDTKKIKLILIRVAVTFLEAAVAYLATTGWNISSKAALAGAVGAGASALYNLFRHYYPDVATLGVSK